MDSSYHLFKLFVIIIISAFTAATCSGCGVKLGSDIVLGTTGYLAEVNRAGASLDYHSPAERAQISSIIEEDAAPQVNLHSWGK
jgi:hypothetical protein